MAKTISELISCKWFPDPEQTRNTDSTDIIIHGTAVCNTLVQMYSWQKLCGMPE